MLLCRNRLAPFIVGFLLVAGITHAQSPNIMQITGDKVGIGIDAPGALLHLKRSDGSAKLRVDEGSMAAGNDTMLELFNAQGAPIIQFSSHFAHDWFFSGGNLFAITSDDDPTNEFIVNKNGDLTISGDFYSTTCPSPTPCAPDFVFEEGYELMPLDQLAEFVRTNRHLPRVPSSEELVGPVNLSKLQMTLLEKIEELTLYAIEVDRTNRELLGRVETLERQLYSLRQANLPEGSDRSRDP